MTIKDEILEDLRKGMSLAEIRRKYRSTSQLYEALTEYLDQAEKIFGAMQKKLEKIKSSLLETEAGLKRVKREKEEVSKELHELVQARDKLIKEVSRRNQELNHLQADIAELRGKGCTPEILGKIKAIEDRSGLELLSHVETVANYMQIEKRVSHLMEKKAGLERKVRVLEKKEEKMKAKLVSERNRLDELKLRTATFREAVATVLSLFREGYSASDIKSLKDGLNALGINGDPLLSITRLVTGLKKYKSLIALEGKVVEIRKELEMLRKATTEAKSELKVAKQLIKTFEEVKNAGVNAIAGTAEHAKRTITGTATTAEKHVTASLGKFDAHIQRTMEGVEAGLGEWGELQEQKGRLKELIHPALVLLGILNSPEYLRQLPLTNVFQLFDRLHLYSEMTLKDVLIRPSQDIWRKDVNLNPWNSYRLPVLIEFVCEGLREIMIQQSRKE